MAAQALSGDRSAALKTYAECQAMLQEEFGIQPARETAVLAIWQALGNLPMTADTYSIRMGIQRVAGENEDLLATGSEAARLSQAIGNTLNHFNALLLAGEIHCMQGRLGQALTHFEMAAAVIEEGDNDQLLWPQHLYRAPVYLIGGALEQAEREADQLYASREVSGPIFQPFLPANVALMRVALGNLREGQAILEQAFKSLDRETPFSFAVVTLMVAKGHLQLALGNPKDVLERTEDVIHRLNQASGRFYLAELLWLQGKPGWHWKISARQKKPSGKRKLWLRIPASVRSCGKS